MKRKGLLLMLMAVGCLLVSSCHITVNKKLKWDDVEVTVVDSLPEYERVVVEAACNVKFVQSDESKMKMKGGKSDLEQIKHYVKDGVLYIDTDSRKGWTSLRMEDFGNVDVVLYSPDLIGIELRGAGEVRVDGLDTDTLDLDLRGAGNVNLRNVVCDEMNALLKGAGEIKIDSLTTKQADIELKGVGNVNVGFNNSGSVKCELKGVGNVKLYGTVRRMKSDVKGTGNIDVSELQVAEK